jgi:membrane protease YdiL (CAAX protease family)
VTASQRPAATGRLTAGGAFRTATYAVVGILVVWNMAANLAVPDAGAALVNAAGVILVITVARRAGADAADLGLRTGSARRAVRFGAAAAGVVVAAVAALTAIPATRAFFADDRFVGVETGEMLIETLIRIPFVTALAEEVAFRGVLLGMLLRWVSPMRAVAASSVLFGLWHVLPAMDSLETNSVVEAGDAWAAVAAAVAGQVVVTGVAGAGLAWLRLRAASLAAPVLAHWAVNGSAYLAGWLVVRHGWV